MTIRVPDSMRQSLWFGIGVVLATGCVAKGDPAAPDEGCVSDEKFFAAEVWGPTLSSNCFQCHNAQGAANQTKFVLRSEAETGFMEANLKIVQDVAAFEVDGTSILLLKPTLQIPHEGGMRIAADGPEYAAIAELVRRMDEPVACEDAPDETYFEGVVMADDVSLLRKVALNLVGRLPTADETARVQDGGEAALGAVLDGMMTEPAFYERLKEIYNDQFLTDRYLRNNDAVDLLDATDYPTRRFYESDEDESRRNTLRSLANYGVAREPLELIAHVVRNNRPFTEIVTADYIMMNSFSARTYGASDYAYVDRTEIDLYNPDEFFEARVPGVPHAGVLTSHMFLNRFPTTDTNVNRHRARMTYQFFLATDVLKLAERPVDPTQIQDHNPTLYNPGCNVCHATIDPVAGAFQNWDDRGRYRVLENGWHSDMRPPGFGETTVPAGDSTQSLRWLGQQIATDDRFATSAIHTMYRALTGEEPLSSQTATLRAFEAQEDLFKAIRRQFIDSGHDFKVMVKALVMSPYVRAKDYRGADRAGELDSVGSAHLLTPEQLDRKIEAVLGFAWERNGRRQLLSTNEMMIFYGGIDSNQITKRITEPNGVMASIATRMANEMSCLAVPQDFTHDAADRRLFPHVEMSFVPEDDNGFEVPGAVERIKDNIRHLHQHILGEEVSSVELERTYALFVDTWREGRAGVIDETIDRDSWNCRAERDPITGEDLPEERRVRRDEDYTMRAWMAVVTYLLSDYDFLYE
jgi:hypothetical protein